MIITDEAKQFIQSILEEQKAEGLRIYAVEGACCGPQIGLSLDAPEATDVVADINGIRMAISPQAKEATDNITLDMDTQDGKAGLVMVGAPTGC